LTMLILNFSFAIYKSNILFKLNKFKIFKIESRFF